jgi:hypothetical protein
MPGIKMPSFPLAGAILGFIDTFEAKEQGLTWSMDSRLQQSGILKQGM